MNIQMSDDEQKSYWSEISYHGAENFQKFEAALNVLNDNVRSLMFTTRNLAGAVAKLNDSWSGLSLGDSRRTNSLTIRDLMRAHEAIAFDLDLYNGAGRLREIDVWIETLDGNKIYPPPAGDIEPPSQATS